MNQIHAADAESRGGDAIAQPVRVLRDALRRDDARPREAQPPPTRAGPKHSHRRRRRKGERGVARWKTEVLSLHHPAESAAKGIECEWRDDRLAGVVEQLERPRPPCDPFERRIQSADRRREQYETASTPAQRMRDRDNDRDGGGEIKLAGDFDDLREELVRLQPFRHAGGVKPHGDRAIEHRGNRDGSEPDDDGECNSSPFPFGRGQG